MSARVEQPHEAWPIIEHEPEDEPTVPPDLYAPVGALVYHAYWDEHYEVLSHNENGTVTVRWLGDSPRFVDPGGRKTHRTPFDPKHETIILRTGTAEEVGL